MSKKTPPGKQINIPAKEGFTLERKWAKLGRKQTFVDGNDPSSCLPTCSYSWSQFNETVLVVIYG
jgi:hypothetical protein